MTADLHAVITAVASSEKRIVIGGHSLGGTLAIHAAATLAEVERIVAIAPFSGVAGIPHELHAVLIPMCARCPTRFMWWDPIIASSSSPITDIRAIRSTCWRWVLSIADAVYADAGADTHARAIDLVINARESSVNNRAVRRLAVRWRRADAPVAVHRLGGLPPRTTSSSPLGRTRCAPATRSSGCCSANVSSTDDAQHII